MNELTFDRIDQTVLDTLRPATRRYWIAVAALAFGIFIGAACWAYQIFVGVGVGRA
ncbi:MAG: hypothetical protein U5R30_10275 [Deltaproteobacteria bacterium]|nr:hypothetical protein [Deltaproteobacteria bacterium]